MKRLLHFGTALLTAVIIALPLTTLLVSAGAPPPPPSSGTNQTTDGPYIDHKQDTAIGSAKCATATNCELVKNYVQPAVDFLAAFVGVAVVISMIYGGIEYASSAGDPQKASSGKKRIRNSIGALLLFFFFYAFLRFVLLPGNVI